MSEPSHERLMLTDASYKAGYATAGAENARLQAENRRLRRSGANVSGLLIDAVETGGEAVTEIERERDRYKAREAALVEALKHGADVCAQAVAGLGADLSTLRSQGINSTHIDRMMRHLEAIDGAREIYRAAIAATPDGAED